MEHLNWRGLRHARGGLLVIAGAALVALLPVTASADSPDAGGLAALVRQVRALQATVTQQSAEIASLQSALASEAAARQAGDAQTLASANAYTDAERNRAEAAEQALASSSTGSGILAAANGYTDTKVGAEASARATADSGLQASINSEVSRAEAVEAGLQTSINSEIGRAQAAEQLAYNSALTNSVAAVDTQLSSLANNQVIGATVTDGQSFWQAIANGFLGG